MVCFQKFPFCAVLVLGVALIVAGCGKKEEVTVRLGLNFELTGDVPTIGSSGKNATELFFRQLHAQGGIPIGGERIQAEPILRDNGANPTQASEVTQQLIMNNGVVAVIGPNSGACAIPSARVAEGLKTVMVTPWSSDAQTTTDPTTGVSKRYVFRVCMTDLDQARVMAGFALKKLGVKAAAVLYDITTSSSREQSEAFRDTFVEGGGKIIAFEAYSVNDKDYALQLAALRDVAADVIFLPASPMEAAAIAKQARAMGITAAFLGTETWISPELLRRDGASLEGSYFCKQFSPQAETEQTKQFVEQYQKLFGKMPDDVAALTYDACNLVAVALHKAGKIEREALREQLAQIRDYQGVTGTITFEPGSGDPIKSVPIMQIKDGKLVWITNAGY